MKRPKNWLRLSTDQLPLLEKSLNELKDKDGKPCFDQSHSLVSKLSSLAQAGGVTRMERTYYHYLEQGPIPPAIAELIKAAVGNDNWNRIISHEQDTGVPELHRRLNQARDAYKNVSVVDTYEILTEFYEQRGVQCHTYQKRDGTRVKVPLYVREQWKSLTEPSLEMLFDDKTSHYEPTREEREFFALFQPHLREALGLKPLRSAEIFHLVDLQQKDARLSLRFERGSFFDSVMCQYYLEYELMLRASTRPRRNPVGLPIRRQIASSVDSVEGFFRKKAARIGVSNLLLLRHNKSDYIPMIGARSSSFKMSPWDQFDPMTAGIFDITSHVALAKEFDFKLRHKVLKEVGGQIFGIAELEEVNPQGFHPPDWFYEGPDALPFLKELKDLLDDGSAASFEVTGFCIDLVRIVPEITTLFVVRDESYFRRWANHFAANKKYPEYLDFFHNVRVPRRIGHFEDYVRSRFPSHPYHRDRQNGFEPMNWTLPGGFCLLQSLKRASEKNLL